jgi:hypothetical protein
MMQRCQSEVAQHIPLTPEKWNLAELERTAFERELKKRREEQARREALADPEKFSQLRAERVAAWNAWRSCVR